MSEYVSIDCGFYDRLEAAAMSGALRTLAYVGENGASVHTEARITDVFSRDGAEWLRLDSGETVRLDRIEALDGHARPGAASCATR